MRILVVEDERVSAEFLRYVLRQDGHAVDLALNGNDGLRLALTEPYDLAILDLDLPGRSGLDIIDRLRARGVAVPVIVLTATEGEDEAARALDEGADDYVTKPFGVQELLARVRAVTRRQGNLVPKDVRVGGLHLDRARHEIACEGEALPLTAKEFQLLEYFMLHPGRVVPRTELLEKVWDLNFDPKTNVLDVHVARLRAKLRKEATGTDLRTVRGKGFLFEATA